MLRIRSVAQAKNELVCRVSSLYEGNALLHVSLLLYTKEELKGYCSTNVNSLLLPLSLPSLYEFPSKLLC